jgi:glycosyltransferase involved in cell wall biosynthesis
MMTATPKISIIMPTYNRAAYIMESINSVLQQTYSNWELIIVDDASEDNTEELVLSIKDDRIQFIKTGKTGLGIKIKNIGIKKTKGEFIAFIDSDDLWAPEKLKKQITALDNHPDAMFSITGAYDFKKAGEPLEYYYKQREGSRYGDIFIAFFRSEASILPQTLLLRRTCMSVIEEYVRTDPHSDVEFLLGLALHYKAVILYEPLLYRRLHDESASSSNWEKGYCEGLEMINRYKESKNLSAAIAKDSLFRLYIHFGDDYLKRNKKIKAIRQFLKAWKYKPLSIAPIKKTGKAILNYF